MIVAAALVTAGAWLGPRPPAPTRLLHQAAAALANGEVGRARVLAERAVGRDHRLAIGQALLARIALAQDDGVGGDSALRRAADSGIDPAWLHHLRAEALVLEGDAAGAQGEAAKAVRPYRLYARRIAARAQALGGDPVGAQEALRSLAEAYPSDGPAWLDLARLSFGMGQIDVAARAAQHAVTLMPTNPGALTLTGNIVRRQRGLAASMPWFDRALAVDATSFPALIDAAATQADLDHYRAMLALTRRALAVRPGAAPPLYLQALLAARAGNVSLARSLLRRTDGALDAMPGMMLLAGAVAYADGRYQEAVSRLTPLVTAQPEAWVARRLLGQALLAAGDPAAAVDVLGPLVAREDASRGALVLAARAAGAIDEPVAALALRRRAITAPLDQASTGTRGNLAAVASTISANPGDVQRR